MFGAVAPRARRVGLGGDEAVRDRRQHLVIDRDQLGGVLCRGETRRDDCGDDLADMAHFRPDDRRLLRADDRRAVLVLDADVGRVAVGDVGQRVEPVRQHVLGGQNGEDARHRPRRRRLDPPDQRMRMRRAHHHRIGLAGQVNIVAIAPVAGEEAQILPPPDRLPDPGAGWAPSIMSPRDGGFRCRSTHPTADGRRMG